MCRKARKQLSSWSIFSEKTKQPSGGPLFRFLNFSDIMIYWEYVILFDNTERTRAFTLIQLQLCLFTKENLISQSITSCQLLAFLFRIFSAFLLDFSQICSHYAPTPPPHHQTSGAGFSVSRVNRKSVRKKEKWTLMNSLEWNSA